MAPSFVPHLSTQDHIERTNPIQMIRIQEDREEGPLLSSQRLLCLVVCCPEVSELSLHLRPVVSRAEEKKTNTVNNCPSA